jgi:hypothetical protein
MLSVRLCEKTVHGSMSAPRAEAVFLQFNDSTVRPELVEGCTKKASHGWCVGEASRRFEVLRGRDSSPLFQNDITVPDMVRFWFQQ